jgi:hypothetical protein
MNVPQCAQAQSLLHHIGRTFLGKEENFYVWSEPTQAPGNLQPTQFGKADIEQNQVWLELFSFLDGFMPIRGFPYDLEIGPLQHRTDKSTEWFIVIDYKHFEWPHFGK